MQTRREFMVRTAAAASLMDLSGCSRHVMSDYDKAELQLRSPVTANPGILDFIRFATLAPSGHNTQPWYFTVRNTGIGILPDISRRTPVVDPDDHHLFVSLGCAAENFLIAAAANGRPGEIRFNNKSEDRIDIDLTHGAAREESLFPAIRESQTTRSKYDGRQVSNENLKQLELAAKVEGVSVILMTERSKLEAILEFVVQGNHNQMDNQAFLEELRAWIRFNPSQALTTSDGLYTKCSGLPTIPSWIGRRLFSHLYRKGEEDRKYSEQVRSSAGIAVFIGDKGDKDHWVKVGRSFQRFALQATALGIRHSLINQPVEVPSVRLDFARWLGIGALRPDLIVRFGYAAPMPMTMRRSVSRVMLPQQ